MELGACGGGTERPQAGDRKGGGSIASGRGAATAFRRGGLMPGRPEAALLVKTFTIALAEESRVATVHEG